jgi:hypothetical protein
MTTMTVDEVRQHRIDIGAAGPPKPGEHRASVSPYREILDARNYWTYLQDTATLEAPELPPPEGALPDVPPVTIDPTSNTLPAAGGTGIITVTVTGEGASGTWTVDKDSTADWLSYAPTEPQTASGVVVYTAAPNPGAVRAAHFYINGKTFTVNQSLG